MKDYERKKEILYSLQDGKCYSCNKNMSINLLTIDHILPKKRALKTIKNNPSWIDELINLRLLCLECHLYHRPAGFSFWHIDKINNLLTLNKNINKQEISKKLDFIDDYKLREHIKKILTLKVREK